VADCAAVRFSGDPHGNVDVMADDLTTATLSPAASSERRSAVNSKPPNILVYCGKKDSGRLFSGVRSVISQCVNTDRYVVYHLKHEQVLSTPWQDNTALLVIASEKVYDGVDREFLRFFLCGGMLLSFGSMFNDLVAKRRDRVKAVSAPLGVVTVRCGHDDGLSVIGTRYCYDRGCRSVVPDVALTSLATEDGTENSIVMEAVHQPSSAVAILSQVCGNCFVFSKNVGKFLLY